MAWARGEEFEQAFFVHGEGNITMGLRTNSKLPVYLSNSVLQSGEGKTRGSFLCIRQSDIYFFLLLPTGIDNWGCSIISVWV